MADRDRPGSRAKARREGDEERLARHRAYAAREMRNRRLQILMVTVLVAAFATTGGLLLFSGGDPVEQAVGTTVSRSATGVRGVQETRALLRGVPQDGYTIGKADAPVTLYSFIDFQCPFCRAHELGVTPAVMREFVRPGRLKITMVPLGNLGDDSIRAAAVGRSLAAKNRFFDFAHLFYFNQGSEGSGYATDRFLRNLVAEIPGAAPSDVTPALTPPVRQQLDANRRLAEQQEVTGTPNFSVAVTGSRSLQRFKSSGPDFVDELRSKIDELAGPPG